MKRILPALVCGFGAAVLFIVPLVNLSCCLIFPGAAFAALILDRKATGSKELIKSERAVELGLFTGLFSALFGTLFIVLIIYVTRGGDFAAGLPAYDQMISRSASNEFSRDLHNFLNKITDEFVNYGFSAIFTLSLFIGLVIINSIMGILGGLMGMQFINNRMNREQ